MFKNINLNLSFCNIFLILFVDLIFICEKKTHSTFLFYFAYNLIYNGPSKAMQSINVDILKIFQIFFFVSLNLLNIPLLFVYTYRETQHNIYK